MRQAPHREGQKMKNTAFRWFGRSLVTITAVLAAACADNTPVSPYGSTITARGAAALADVSEGNRFPDLASCGKLAAPVGSTLVLQAFGIGVQIYRWSGTSWEFVAPSAKLFADAGAQGEVASHFGGPTWKSNSGGSVVGTVVDRCVADEASIPWVSLSAVSSGPGVFEKVKFIQRLNTVGGNAPSTPGNVVGQEVSVPYTADYLFYQTP
jgi:hypothetical protein